MQLKIETGGECLVNIIRCLALIALALFGFSTNFRAFGQADAPAKTPTAVSGSAARSSVAPTAPVAPVLDQVEHYDARCFPQPNLVGIDSAEAKFARLKEARQQIAQFSQQANNDRDSYKQRLDQRNFSFGLPQSYPSPVKIGDDDLDDENEKVAAEANRLKEELDTAENAAPRNTDVIAKLKAQKTNIDLELAGIKRRMDRRAVDKQQASDLQKHFDELNKSRAAEINLLQGLFKSANSDIDCLNRALSQIDETINTILIPETQKNQFKLYVSGIFAFMVILVIVGFFTIALRDKAVGSAIFSNQTGIQFVTLFSLVIAIILFGITEILQAKELSALLG
jgi:hypothetical protein